VAWQRFRNEAHARQQKEKSSSALEKLHRLKKLKLRKVSTASTLDPEQDLSTIPHEYLHKLSVASRSAFEDPRPDEIAALTRECFPPIEQSRVIITEFTRDALRTSTYSLGEVLASECILQPGDFVERVRWIYVEYHKMGTFWGSDYRFAQWGTDPALFEKSPILLLQDRMAELDRRAGRETLEEEDLPGESTSFFEGS
jgi:hypothetical protein